MQLLRVERGWRAFFIHFRVIFMTQLPSLPWILSIRRLFTKRSPGVKEMDELLLWKSISQSMNKENPLNSILSVYSKIMMMGIFFFSKKLCQVLFHIHSFCIRTYKYWWTIQWITNIIIITSSYQFSPSTQQYLCWSLSMKRWGMEI